MPLSRRFVPGIPSLGFVALTIALGGCAAVGNIEPLDGEVLGDAGGRDVARSEAGSRDVAPGTDTGVHPPVDSGVIPVDSGIPPVMDSGTTTTGTLCNTCAMSSECGAGNYCLYNTMNGQHFCGQDCASSGCPGGYTCTSIGGTAMQCVPSSGACAVTTGCSPACPAGQTCSGGTCVGGGTDAGTTGTDAGTGTMSATDMQMVAAINAARAVARVCSEPGMSGSFAPAPPLTWSPLLAMSAHRESADMAAGNFISHTGSDGSTPFTRISDTGYRYTAAGENIAVGQPTVDAVMSDWLSDYGHCANIMSPDFSNVGTSLVIGPTGYRYYWTQDFGHP